MFVWLICMQDYAFQEGIETDELQRPTSMAAWGVVQPFTSRDPLCVGVNGRTLGAARRRPPAVSSHGAVVGLTSSRATDRPLRHPR
jgi:hypothetical protein